jgi:hypothetical protein
MDIKLLRVVDVLAHPLQNDHLEESLDNTRLGRDEYSGRLVAGVGSPVLGLGDVDDILPVGNSWKDLEGLGKRSGLVAREDFANPGVFVSGWSQLPDKSVSRIGVTYLVYTSTTLGGSSYSSSGARTWPPPALAASWAAIFSKMRSAKLTDSP